MGTKKQTSTEWIYEQLTSTWFDKSSGQHILEQAKEMEKQHQLSDEEIEVSAKEYILYNDQKRNWVIEGMKLYREHLKQK